MAQIDFPPDDFTLNVTEWLRGEVYPGLLQEPFDDLAFAVWVGGINGFIGLWTTGFASHAAPRDRLQLCKHEIFLRIYNIKFPPPAPTPIDGAMKGRLRYRVGGLWEDDRGPVAPLFCHYMQAFSDWLRDSNKVENQLNAIRDAGYHGIRFLDVLGYYDSAWQGREVTPIPFTSKAGRHIPATPDFYGRKRAFLELVASKGLKVMDDRGDQNAWSIDQKLTHMRKNGELYNDDFGKNILAGVWASNESWQNGVPTPDEAAGILQAFGDNNGGWFPDTRGLSWGAVDWDAPGAGELPEDLIHWSRDPATVGTMHGNRVPNEHIIAHYLGYGYYDSSLRARGKRTWNTEPVGGGDGVTVGQENRVSILCGIAWNSLITGQAWTHMSGNGAIGTGPIQDHPGFVEVPRLLQWLPRDIHTFDVLGHAGPRFQGSRILAQQGTTQDRQRGDFAINSRDGRFCMTVYGDNQNIPFERAISNAIAIRPETGETVPFRANRGEPWSIPYDGQDQTVLVTGQLA